MKSVVLSVLAVICLLAICSASDPTGHGGHAETKPNDPHAAAGHDDSHGTTAHKDTQGGGSHDSASSMSIELLAALFPALLTVFFVRK